MIVLGTVLSLVVMGTLYWWVLGATMEALSALDRRRRMNAYLARKRGQ